MKEYRLRVNGFLMAAMRDVAIIPLHLQKSVWATRRGLSYEPRIDELTLATSVSLG